MTTSLEYSSDYPLQGLTLLVSDDEMRLRQIIVLMAEELGATVIDVETSEKAIAVYAQKQQEIDLVMLDLRMAGMSGESAYRKIKEMNPGAKVALSSGIRPEEDFVSELESDGGAFIEKPFDMDGLAKILCKLADRPFQVQ
jgi:two-component system, cell cycle sensor histidine kinase and response regulator CckA